MTDWDAVTYHRVAEVQEEWGREVLARLDLRGDETVLDAGCGTGRVTRLLLERLPEGRVIGVDAAPSMIAKAREAIGGDKRVELEVRDLLDLDLDREVDAIFSNAAFHWILDHARLFARLFAALRPGGALEAQCGGQDNVAEFVRAIESAEGDERFSQYLRGIPASYNFASVGDTQARLARAGFDAKPVWLDNRSYAPSEPAAFVRASGLAQQLERLPEHLHDEYVDAVLGSMPRPLVLDYVRLNISARRPT
ncbi:MAG TPA: methyltransferase domain-containing protein [Solirubrobacterales bacterium]|nr:methyltransferase domain-containing protein [Solirubrobacterales bacterium]